MVLPEKSGEVLACQLPIGIEGLIGGGRAVGCEAAAELCVIEKTTSYACGRKEP